MRQIILDTETTGLEPKQGHRIIELAGVELINRRLTGNHFHRYLNPEREIDEGALQVHGITLEFLQDKPRFADVAAEFLDYIQDAELIIHNAPFDVGFLNTELEKAGLTPLSHYCSGVLDTLAMAREMRPGQRNSLDALCKYYGIDNSNRTLHGALLDCELLGAVYLAMTRGQESLMMLPTDPGPGAYRSRSERRRPLPVNVPAEELSMHEAQLDALDRECGGVCLWHVSANQATEH